MTTSATTIGTRAIMVACAALLGSLAVPAASAAEGQPESRQDGGVPGTAPAASPAQLGVAPLRLELDGPGAIATLRITNPSSRDVPVQLRLFAWTQEGGEDRYAPSSDLALSPSITAIPAGQTQVFRLMRTAAPLAGEKRYRVAIDQIPDGEAQRSGVAEARIRFTVPVFVGRAQAQPADLSWRLLDDRLELANRGGRTARIAGIGAKSQDGKPVQLQRSGLRYVHGGSAISWPLDGGCALGPVAVSAQVDDRTIDAQAQPACN